MTEPSPEGQREFTLALVRKARSRVQTMVFELDEIGVALKHNLIEPSAAVTWLDHCGATYFLPLEIDGGVIKVDDAP